MQQPDQRYPIRKAHYVGSSVVLTIDVSHVKRLNIDELTFFVQKPIEKGIVLEIHKIDTVNETFHRDDDSERGNRYDVKGATGTIGDRHIVRDEKEGLKAPLSEN
jgi:hypothetical protein